MEFDSHIAGALVLMEQGDWVHVTVAVWMRSDKQREYVGEQRQLLVWILQCVCTDKICEACLFQAAAPSAVSEAYSH